ncbi:MAG: GGDEF domain-containing protein [bacterium]
MEYKMDKLTGLYDEKSFFMNLNQEISRATRYKRPLTVLVFEVNFDCFDKTSDLRWSIGYSVFKQIGALLQKVYRNVDILGRCEGDTFGVMLPETAPEGGRLGAERFRKAVEEYRFIGDAKNERVQLAVDGGMAFFPAHGKKARELFASAYRAMKLAQSKGGNLVEEPPEILYEEGSDEPPLPKTARMS